MHSRSKSLKDLWRFLVATWPTKSWYNSFARTCHIHAHARIHARTHSTQGNVRVSKCTDKSLELPDAYDARSPTTCTHEAILWHWLMLLLEPNDVIVLNKTMANNVINTNRSVDIVFMCDVYHHLVFPRSPQMWRNLWLQLLHCTCVRWYTDALARTFMRSMWQALIPGGKFFLLDFYRDERWRNLLIVFRVVTRQQKTLAGIEHSLCRVLCVALFPLVNFRNGIFIHPGVSSIHKSHPPGWITAHVRAGQATFRGEPKWLSYSPLICLITQSHYLSMTFSLTHLVNQSLTH